ncbi:MAG: glycosyltransferase family 4 protein [Candidatus Omnitrophica bacterium]|nr:glycosyltransferase family 4 protein [Candidatus Omnitrophota bacterium]
MRILFIVPYPTEGPSNRYRVEQYLPYLKEHGIRYYLRPFISSGFYKILYYRGNKLTKCIYFLSSCIGRAIDIVRAASYDIIFIHIEAFPFGPPLLEFIFYVMGKPIIFDFEDAIYLPSPDKKSIFRWLRFPRKFYLNINLSTHVLVCNNYLKKKLAAYNPNITVIPTSIDTVKFRPKDYKPSNGDLVIGWIGSHTTLPCLKLIIPALQKLSKKYKFILKIVGGGAEIEIPGVKVINEKWALQKDVENFQSLDIGIYPLPDNEWAMAKTPFKTIQYMSVGVPTVASCVGGNREIIEDGINGFLTSSEEEWIEKLSLLIENPQLRQKLGIAGRKTVEERYSLNINAPRFMEVLNKVYDKKYKK